MEAYKYDSCDKRFVLTHDKIVRKNDSIVCYDKIFE